MSGVPAALGHQPVPVSVIVQVCNGAAYIGECLASLQGWAAQVLVVDLGSRDQSVALARSLADQVLVRPLAPGADPGEVRNESARFASQEWVLYLEANERVTVRLGEVLGLFLAELPAGISAIQLPHKTVFLGQWLRHTGRWWPRYQHHLLRRQYYRWRPAGQGGGLVVNGLVARLPETDAEAALVRQLDLGVDQFLGRVRGQAR